MSWFHVPPKQYVEKGRLFRYFRSGKAAGRSCALRSVFSVPFEDAAEQYWVEAVRRRWSAACAGRRCRGSGSGWRLLLLSGEFAADSVLLQRLQTCVHGKHLPRCPLSGNVVPNGSQWEDQCTWGSSICSLLRNTLRWETYFFYSLWCREKELFNPRTPSGLWNQFCMCARQQKIELSGYWKSFFRLPIF